MTEQEKTVVKVKTTKPLNLNHAIKVIREIIDKTYYGKSDLKIELEFTPKERYVTEYSVNLTFTNEWEISHRLESVLNDMKEDRWDEPMVSDWTYFDLYDLKAYDEKTGREIQKGERITNRHTGKDVPFISAYTPTTATEHGEVTIELEFEGDDRIHRLSFPADNYNLIVKPVKREQPKKPIQVLKAYTEDNGSEVKIGATIVRL